MIDNLSLVVLFGCANVGKSTLFNTLIEKRQALVSPIEGTTRDANIGVASWRGVDFTLVDTGGIIDLQYLFKKKVKAAPPSLCYGEAKDIETKVQQQARDYIKRADLILFMVDGRAGLLPADRQMAVLVKKILGKKNNIIYIINKVDSPKQRKELAEFHKLPLGEPLPISAATGSGTGDLLDVIVNKLTTYNLQPTTQKEIRNSKFEIRNSINVCILGKPNVGKSSLLNAIMGEERVMVSPAPHTTREPQDTDIKYEGRIIKLVDTAGISKKGQRVKIRGNEVKIKTEEDLIVMGIAKSLAALNRADIALLVLDINEPITHQDQSLVAEILDRKKSLIIIANKWDLVPERNTKKFTNYIYARLPFIAWVPIQFISAKTDVIFPYREKAALSRRRRDGHMRIKKIKRILDLILQVDEARRFEMSDSAANTFMMRLVKIHRPSKGKGMIHPRVHGFRQTGTNPPQFELHIGSKEDLHASYLRFIENRLREKFGLLGTPIVMRVEKGKRVHGLHN